jgi:hypothetical protein
LGCCRAFILRPAESIAGKLKDILERFLSRQHTTANDGDNSDQEDGCRANQVGQIGLDKVAD